MERVKRRWWTRGVSMLAALVVISAVISGLFQLAVLTLPSYRADLATWVTQVANRPVQIGGVNLGWRGLAPRLDLADITLYSEDGNESLTLDRLSLGFSLLRLVTGNVFPYRLEVSGLTLLVEVDADNNWEIAGFAAGDGGSLSSKKREAWAKDLARFTRLTLRNCTIVLSGPRFGEEPQQIQVARIDIDQGSRDFELEGRLRLPATHGEMLRFNADFDGQLADPSGWSGDFELSAERLRPQGWVAPWLKDGVQIGAQDFGLSVEGRLKAGKLQNAALAADVGALIVARAGQSTSVPNARLRADVRAESGGWSVELRELRLGAERAARGILHWRPLAGGHSIDVDAEELRIGPVTPWLGIWRQVPERFAQADRLSGTLRNVVLRLRADADRAPRYSLTARLDGLALADHGKAGFSNLSGELSADENSGQLRVLNMPLQVHLPKVLPQAIPVDSLRAQAQWRRVSDGWRINSSEFAWQAIGTEGNGRLQLDLPDDPERSVLIDLSAKFSGDDVRSVKPYVLRHWPQSLRDWIERAVVKGRVPRGDLMIRGSLRDFPYQKHPNGEWRLNLDIVGATLAFAPDWPSIDNINAHLRFAGNGLQVEAQSAKFGGNTVEHATAAIDDFAAGILKIDVEGNGEATRLYETLRASPLRKTLAGLLDHTRASGPAQLGLQLMLPLHDLHSTQVKGAVTLDDVQMSYTGLEPPISGISGMVRFDNRTLAGENIVARFQDLPLAVRIEPRADTHGVVIADFDFAPNVDGRGASQFIPGFLRSRIQGQSRWRAELPIRERDTALVLTSGLVGTALDLPEPLGKPAASNASLSLRIGGDAAAPLRIGLHYAQTLQADLAFGASSSAPSPPVPATASTSSAPHLLGVRVRFGSQPAPAAEAGDFIVDGRAETMDLSSWIAILTAGTGGNDNLRVDSVDLDIGHVRWRDQLSGKTRLRYVPLSGSWRVSLAGPGAQGTIDWNGPSPGRIVARLEHLVLTPQLPALPEPGSESSTVPPPDTSPPIEPARLPEFDVVVERLTGAGADLGRVAMRSARMSGGQRLEQLTVAGGILDLSASGQWRRIDGRSWADLRYTLKSRDSEALLKAMAYAPNLSAQSSESSGELKWLPSPTGLFWHAANGRIELAADDGQLRAVKPGASRALGLINFFTLPRRLTLNFRDVVDDGLSFDKIRGHFTLGGGAAVTDDLSIDGPSLRMEVRGRVGLAARDYDQRVTVYPGLSGGVTLGAALLGGPAVGALVLLAQELLDKPLDQVTQLTYHVSGSWDNPKVERGEARAVKPAEIRKK